ncbi:hypothetical protein [Mariniplasma anaerobium]|uniref:Uncharacterized protein n=1 Tax=Mariniplasma anaerobium TaxID=2735436 RepID=A0A7U9THC1_9MOLU|nr:hypothetical protein [Mariniplasma anaerobium]BCR35242.1 hypothetical protein MPAN_001350 [Mariniplasma anaerobium]
MKKFINNKKSIIVTLLLILTISNFSLAFAYWASNISGSQSNSDAITQIGEWDFEDVALVVATFQSDHAVVLSLTETTVTVSDKTGVEAALAAYGLLSDDAKAQLTSEETLLLSLLNQIIALENSEFLDFESTPYDNGLTGTVDINGRTWYANDVYIAGDVSYDVWNDVRSLALRSTAYFESQDLFINGIDKITLYHGALNYNDGTNFQFKVEYELDSNPGVWVTLQDGGSDLLIDVISATPLTFTEINVNITEALNIRFTPIIESTANYINLDDITIYEHVVSGALEATTFRTIYAGALALDVVTVEISDKATVQQALAAYDLLSIDAQTELSVEKALLDSLLVEINLQEDLAEATASVVIAENSNLQIDVDSAQILVTALPSSAEKTALQNRLDDVQDIIDAVAGFQSDHAVALALSVGTVTPSDQTIVEAALTAYNLLSADVKAKLTVEKALLDSLLIEINNQIPTATQVAEFQSDHQVVLALSVGTVTPSDLTGVQLALDAYALLSVDAKAALTTEKALLDSLLIEINLQIAEAAVIIAEGSNLQADVNSAQVLVSALPDGIDKTNLQDRLDDVQNIIDAVATFQSDHAVVLSLTETTVTVSDKTGVEAALAAYGLLSDDAKAQLTSEETLLLSLLNQIIALENSEFLDFESTPYDNGLTGTVDINGRTWYANDVYIAGDVSYDVWNDVRSLALRSTAYFESQDLFINGIDKITLYHGALNYNDGTNFQFKVEYELDSNPGVWVTLQDGGSDLLIDVISATPLTFTEINVNITEALNIRFTPIIESTANYINLDDITIYEHVVSGALEATTFRTIYAGALALDVVTVEISDKATVQQALAAYDLLSIDAQTELSVEKALLDSLLVEINLQEDLAEATASVVIAENSNLQIDVDSAQILVTALPSSAEKTALQIRLDDVQDIIDAVAGFQSDHAIALALSVGTVTPSDQTIVEAALTAYNLLSADVKAELTDEKALLDSLLIEINNQIPTATQVAEFQSDHQVVLALSVGTVTPSDLTGAQLALDAYALLSVDAKAALTTEKALLDSLLVDINLQIAEAAVIIAEGSNLQADVNSAQVLVTALPSSTEKTALQVRLDDVQNIVNIQAANAVDSLITALPSLGAVAITDQTQIVAARTAYNALTAIQKALVVNEALLTSIEADLANLIVANAAVVVAETSNLQADVNSAQVLVTALTNGTSKTALQNRLNTVQGVIDVEAARVLIINYFSSNIITVSKLNNATAIKEAAFSAAANNVVSGLNVIISITGTNEVDRRNTTYTINIIKNGVSVTINVDVDFTR